jgi:glucose dehydrogenase
MFVTASYSRLFALDAKTGKKLWKYEHRLPEGIMPCCDVINRGAALYDNLVIFATLDAQLVALNKDTGKVVWKDKIDDYAAGYSATAAPLIVKGWSSPACPVASSACRAAWKPAMPRPARWCGCVRPSKATWATSG